MLFILLLDHPAVTCFYQTQPIFLLTIFADGFIMWVFHLVLSTHVGDQLALSACLLQATIRLGLWLVWASQEGNRYRHKAYVPDALGFASTNTLLPSSVA